MREIADDFLLHVRRGVGVVGRIIAGTLVPSPSTYEFRVVR
jgi:hypothetical protein